MEKRAEKGGEGLGLLLPGFVNRKLYSPNSMGYYEIIGKDGEEATTASLDKGKEVDLDCLREVIDLVRNRGERSIRDKLPPISLPTLWEFSGERSSRR
jgi:hypothetical protein